jgi:hypothetical protein
MTCEFCGNADQTLLEATDRGWTYCSVCSRVSRAPSRPPLREGQGRTPSGGAASGQHVERVREARR